MYIYVCVRACACACVYECVLLSFLVTDVECKYDYYFRPPLQKIMI